MTQICENSDLLVFSHLRWNFVYQRPQHLMSRFAKYRRVFYIEEPVFVNTSLPRIEICKSEENVHIVVPYLSQDTEINDNFDILASLIDDLIYDEKISYFSCWYYTPMSLPYTRHLEPQSILFDVMDELSLFKFASPLLADLESELFKKADLVFTGGQSLFDAKKHRHDNIHSFPSSIDKDHFSKAREKLQDPDDQSQIAHPRIGFYGVIDERFDIELLRCMAELKSNYQFIIIGPVVKIDPSTLPDLQNIHYLGQKNYLSLPKYLANWDCAMMPFALNDSTRFISPTKTPEFLAAGRPVVSTRINDVVRPYADLGLVHIADSATEFVHLIEIALAESKTKQWINKVDFFLKNISWDVTWEKMARLEHQSLARKKNDMQSTSKIESSFYDLVEAVT